MTTSATFATLFVLATAMTQAVAITHCDNDLIDTIMAANAKNCPTDILEAIHTAGPQITFRVVANSSALAYTCFTGVLEEPTKNVAVLHNKLSFVNESLGHRHINYTMLEGNCGFFYKYVAEDNYVGFKIIFSYVDGISFGYYGCSDEPTLVSDDDGEMYSVCFTPFEDSEEVEASLQLCKAHMELVTGDTDLVMTAACDNNNEYLEVVTS